jgi:hypothetical protein
VYVCENVYDESRRIVRSLPQTGLKGYDYQSTSVIADEVFYFKTPIQPQKVKFLANPKVVIQKEIKVTFFQEMPPPTNSRLMMDIDNDDSLDATPSIGSTETSMVSQGTKKVSVENSNLFTVFLSVFNTFFFLLKVSETDFYDKS